MTFLEQLDTLSDPTRCRLLRVLEQQELTVGELCSALSVPQSTASRHLKHLVDSSWLQVRQEGSRRFYRFSPESLASRDSKLWALLKQELGELEPVFGEDRKRLLKVLNDRKLASASFFSATATEWDRLRLELLGDRVDLYALLGLLDPTWVVADLGCGTGVVSASLAPFVGQVIAVDSSSEMLAAAEHRLDRYSNIELRSGDLESLPLEDKSVDAGILFLVLQYTASPWNVLAEAVRVLKPGAPLLLVDLVSHESEELRQRMGHLWQGFSEMTMREHLERSGFETIHWVELEEASQSHKDGPKWAKSPPTLFSCTARTPLAEPSAAVVDFPQETSSGSRDTGAAPAGANR